MWPTRARCARRSARRWKRASRTAGRAGAAQRCSRTCTATGCWSRARTAPRRRAAVGDPAWRALAPLGEAAAQLLAELDFALVRQCEHSDCVLWFHDTTKSHRRRWCAMALCGNRHKVSEFRKRRGG
ncbi:hypothetical protein FE772_10180 [Lysobacter enzymogenes]|nr:hypothetical protein FE772_10180 [Lysobacter enzymogenes]